MFIARSYGDIFLIKVPSLQMTLVCGIDIKPSSTAAILDKVFFVSFCTAFCSKLWLYAWLKVLNNNPIQLESYAVLKFPLNFLNSGSLKISGYRQDANKMFPHCIQKAVAQFPIESLFPSEMLWAQSFYYLQYHQHSSPASINRLISANSILGILKLLSPNLPNASDKPVPKA